MTQWPSSFYIGEADAMHIRGKPVRLGAGAVVCLTAAATLHAYPRAFYLETLCLDSDLVVVGRITAIGSPVQRSSQPALGLSGHVWGEWYRLCNLRATEVIHRKPPAGPKEKAGGAAEAGSEICVWVPCRRPGDASPAWVHDLCGNHTLPDVQWGGTYCMILRRAGEKSYWLPTTRKHFAAAEEAWVAKVHQAAAVEKWPWGKPVNGLQAALVLPAEGTWPPSLRSFAIVALRNASTRPLSLNLSPGDYHLEIRATDAGGRMVREDYREFALGSGRFDPKSVQTLAPGGIGFVTFCGMGNAGYSALPGIPAGQWMVRALYRSQRTAERLALWTGEVRSRPVRWPPGPEAHRSKRAPGANASGTSPGSTNH